MLPHLISHRHHSACGTMIVHPPCVPHRGNVGWWNLHQVIYRGIRFNQSPFALVIPPHFPVNTLTFDALNRIFSTDILSRCQHLLTPISNTIIFISVSPRVQHCQLIIGQCPIACNDKVAIASVLAGHALTPVCIAGFIYPKRA